MFFFVPHVVVPPVANLVLVAPVNIFLSASLQIQKKKAIHLA
jgi:hypothetical protein